MAFSDLFLLTHGAETTKYQVIQISKSQSELPAYTTFQTMHDIIKILLQVTIILKFYIFNYKRLYKNTVKHKKR